MCFCVVAGTEALYPVQSLLGVGRPALVSPKVLEGGVPNVVEGGVPVLARSGAPV
jgi:hypothetical protein